MRKEPIYLVKALLFTLCIFCTELNAQYLHEKLSGETNMSIQEIIDDTEKYHEKIGKGKGTGYKQFQRWKYWVERNLDENGRIRDRAAALKAYNKFKDTTQPGNKSSVSSYIEMGPLETTITSSWSSGLGRVTSIGLDKLDDNHIIIGGQTGGIWKTTDLGANWTPLFDDQVMMDVYALEISHSNSDHYFAGLSNGIVKSVDGGVTWYSVSGIGTELINTITMHPTNPNIVFAIGQSSAKVYKSVNGGEIFTLSLDMPSGRSLYDLEFHPTNPDIIYASGNDGFYKSTNGGSSFVEITNGPWSGDGNTIMMAVTPAAPESVYLLEETGGGFNALYLTENGGASWTTLSDNACQCNNIMGYNQTGGGGQAPRDMDILVSPINPNIIHVAGVETWRSLNKGTSWTQTTEWNVPSGTNFIHADIDILIYDDERIIAGTDGGIYYSLNEADSWTDISAGLGIRQFYRIGASQTDADRVSGGSQDNGTGIVRNGVWYDYLGADGMETFIDWSNENIVYGTLQFGPLYKSIDGGNSVIGTITQAGNQSGNWVTPFEQDPIDANTIYTAKFEIWKSTDGGTSWNTISNFGQVERADEMKIARTNNQYIYASYDNDFRTTINGGTTWTSSTLPGNRVNYIAVHPTDPSRLAVTISGSTTKVMESFDAGASWTDITGNIPSGVSIECAIYENVSNAGLFIGGNPGIYYLENTANVNWVDESGNMPKVRVSELEIRNQVMYVATYGRGLWKFEFVCDGSLTGQACNDLDACTINDVFDVNCNCAGTFADTDADGVCDGLDVCPGGDDTIDGDNDGVPDFCDGCAVGCPDADCDSVCDADDICPDGDDTRDMDNDGIPDYCDPCDEQIGMSCNDNDACTTTDVYDSDCNCAGTFADADGDGVCDANDLCAGSDDTIDTDGDSIPDGCDSCNDLVETPSLTLGIRLDAYPEETSWEFKDAQGLVVASSSGTYSNYANGDTLTEAICLPDGCYDFIISDSFGDGMCCSYGQGNYTLRNASGLIIATGGDFGTSETTAFCIDNNIDCSANGGDVDGDGICADVDCDDDDANAGGASTACDDGDACTTGDVYDANCNCAGTLADADNDGVCDADDVCLGFDDNLIGTSCDDNDSCTTGDTWDTNCNCTGTLQDADNDGVCDADDVCPGFDDNLIGTTCNDNDNCTTGDVWDANCNCAGTFADADNDGACDADDACPGFDDNLIGTACDDGDSNTTNDTWDADCNCTGISVGDCTPTTTAGGAVQSSNGNQNCRTFNFSGTHINVEFSLSGVNSKLNGKPSSRYIDLVTVSYTDANGAAQTQGTYTSNTTVNIAGPATSVIVCIEDNDGDLGASVQANVGTINSCAEGGDPGCTPGDSCDDGDDCTVGDVYDANCGCAGTFIDNDDDGVCAANDPNDNDPCIPVVCSGCTTINEESFEGNWGVWNDGGNDVVADATFANTGTNCVRLRDNSGQASSIYTDPLDLSNYTSIDFSFSFITNSMETGEDLLLEMSTNGGSSYATVQSWVSGSDFINGTRYNETVSINGYNSNTVFRLRCDASANNDRVYIDDVVIEDCSNNLTPPVIEERLDNTGTYLTIYPNPASTQIMVDLSELTRGLNDGEAQIQIFTIDGKEVYNQTQELTNLLEIGINHLKGNELYLLHLQMADGSTFRGKFLKF